MKKKVFLGLAVLICIGAAIAVFFGSQGQEKEKTPVKVQTSYSTLEFPARYADALKYTETVEGDVTVEIFSMIHGSGDVELFRVCFGETGKGTVEGYLNLDSGEIPVSVVIENGDRAESLDGEAVEQYYAMMDALNVVLDSLYRDERFSKKSIAAENKTQNQLAYWSFDLPADIACEETVENDQYHVSFSYIFAGEQILLYTVYLGGPERESLIGYYTADAEAKPIYLEISKSVQQDAMPEEAKNGVYAAMDTINHVVDTIMSNEHFSVPEAENE